MLPAGLAAQPAGRAEHARLASMLPTARSVVELLVGACSCDLVRPRQLDSRDDEREHRARSRRAGGGRAALITGLERHRRGARVGPPSVGWPAALAAFVAEHARNAGDSLYLLRFDLPASVEEPTAPTRRLRAAEVVARPESWLAESVPVLVSR
jgi:hypothetical protein